MNGYRPLLVFVAGLIATSVALIAAAFAAVDDAWPQADWKLPLLAFIGWMAVTIFWATLAAAYLQIRRVYKGQKTAESEKIKASWYDMAVAVSPALPGLMAAGHLIRMALNQNAPFFFGLFG